MATLQVSVKPCIVKAVFEIKDEDIRLTQPIEGIFGEDISRNKTAIIERQIYLSKIKPQLKPYVSQAELRYE